MASHRDQQRGHCALLKVLQSHIPGLRERGYDARAVRGEVRLPHSEGANDALRPGQGCGCVLASFSETSSTGQFVVIDTRQVFKAVSELSWLTTSRT